MNISGSAGIKISLGVSEGHLQSGFISLGICFNALSVMLLCTSQRTHEHKSKFTYCGTIPARPLAVT